METEFITTTESILAARIDELENEIRDLRESLTLFIAKTDTNNGCRLLEIDDVRKSLQSLTKAVVLDANTVPVNSVPVTSVPTISGYPQAFYPNYTVVNENTGQIVHRENVYHRAKQYIDAARDKNLNLSIYEKLKG